MPLRVVAAGFGHKVDYDQESQKVVIDGNLQKPLVDADGCVYKWGVIVRPGTGKFSSIAVGTDNLAFKNGVELNLFPTYFAPSGKREYVRLKYEPRERFIIHAGGRDYNLGEQLLAEPYIQTAANSFYEVAFFDMTGDGNNEILVYAGNPSGYILTVFLFYAFDEEHATTYPLPVNGGDGKYAAQGDSGVSYMTDGSLRLYSGNGGACQELSWNESMRELELFPLRY